MRVVSNCGLRSIPSANSGDERKHSRRARSFRNRGDLVLCAAGLNFRVFVKPDDALDAPFVNDKPCFQVAPLRAASSVISRIATSSGRNPAGNYARGCRDSGWLFTEVGYLSSCYRRGPL